MMGDFFIGFMELLQAFVDDGIEIINACVKIKINKQCGVSAFY